MPYSTFDEHTRHTLSCRSRNVREACKLRNHGEYYPESGLATAICDQKYSCYETSGAIGSRRPIGM